MSSHSLDTVKLGGVLSTRSRPCSAIPVSARTRSCSAVRAQKTEEATRKSAMSPYKESGQPAFHLAVDDQGRPSLDEGQNGADAVRTDGVYPHYESAKDDTDFLPRREPGSFPNVHVNSPLQEAMAKWKSLSAAPSEGTAAGEAPEFDPLRDGPLRYLGYANEVGEAFAAWLPFWGVPFSYAVAISYVLTDTADKGSRAYRSSQSELSANSSLHAEVDVPKLVKLLALERTVDTVVWQLLASVACPGYTIHTVVALVHSAIKPLEETSQAQQLAAGAAGSLHVQAADVLTILDKSFPTLMGLAAIPFIVHPIDNAIHALMNVSLRPAMRRYVCGPGQGALAGLQMCEECAAIEASESSKNSSA